jgi:small subunit ribosomal protein S4
MARYIGPKIKISRRFGVKLGLRTNEEGVTRRPYRPGQHGPKGRRGRPKEYELQLLEKQKARFIYGVLERQFRNYYEKASKHPNVGLVLLQLLESRLDTVVYRTGFALTQNQARQYVTHGHVLVNGAKVGIPSYQLKPGDSLTVETALIELVGSQRGFAAELPAWISVDGSSASMLALPTREQITSLVNEQLIVEFYSR